ncbi:MAG: hypothetical protein BA867_03080 [Desulfobacterales bacterium S5133MH16]|nr:MAG: hypothetical protein BA867_03080 [Desulfobacterales bacterium S5133MH16]
MIFTKKLPYESITNELSKDDTISIISCNNCVRIAGTGGGKTMKEVALRLKGDGYNVKDGFLITKACPQPYMGIVRLNPLVDTLILLACNAGCSTAKRVFPGMKIVRTMEDVGLLITDTDKGVVKLAMAFDKFKDLVGKEFEIGTGKQMSSEQIKVEV